MFSKKRKRRPLPLELVARIIKGSKMLKVELRDINDIPSLIADSIVAGYTLACKEPTCIKLLNCDIAYHEEAGILLIIPPIEKDLAEIFINITDSGWNYLELDHSICST